LDIKCDRKTALTHEPKICYMTNNLFLKNTITLFLEMKSSKSTTGQ